MPFSFCPAAIFQSSESHSHEAAAKHMARSHAFGSCFYAGRSLLMPAESMVIGSECGSATCGTTELPTVTVSRSQVLESSLEI